MHPPTDAPDLTPDTTDADAPSFAPPSPALVAGLLRSLAPHKRRAGYTKNHGNGTPKAKRAMARQSRRTNRGK
jgi:hypothetical protein